MECPCSAFSPADPKILSWGHLKMSKFNSLLALHKLHTQVNIFGFTFLDLLIKFMKMRLLYILYCPPTPATWRQGSSNPFVILHVPIYRSPPPSAAHRGGRGGVGPITRSHFWPAQREGGDLYNTTTCRMAKDTKDPCISHVDASHAELPRTESSLLFCIFFYIVKIMKKSLFYEPEFGFIGKITY
jgi:hypothetical protein